MKLKKALKNAFTPPTPQGRDRFIKSLSYPKLSYFEFILSQICYIRKRIWVFSAALLMMSIGAVCVVSRDKMYAIWIVSAFVPFLALLTASELSRSDMFGMSEIESGCRFSLPQLTVVRMIILGVTNLTVLPIISIILGSSSPFGIVRTALYILTPYIIVNGISLVILNKVSGSDGIYFSAAAAVGVSLAGALSFRKIAVDMHLINTVYLSLCVIGSIIITVQLKKIMIGRDNCNGIKN